jgi:hypothetical protein
MTKQQILEMTGLSEQEFYNKYPDQQSFMMEYGGMVEQYKKGGWIQKATASIKRRGTEGKCTPMSKPGCTGRALALAKTFHKMAAKRKKKEEGGYVDMYAEGGKIPDSVLRSRLESHMSPAEAQDYIDNYEQGGMVDVYQLMGMPTPSMYAMGGDVMMEDYARGGMIKRKDGSYSRRGLWDNIRANRGSGKKPTAEMLKQERKIRAAEKKEYGGMVNMYGMGGTTNIGDLSHVISAKNFPNMGYAMGGPVMYKKGGFLTGLGDFGLAMADPITSIVNPDIIGADSYSDTGFGKTMKGISDVTGGITNAAAPIVAGAIGGPIASAAVGAAQNMSKQFVPQQQDTSTTRQIGNMFGSLAPLGGAIYAASAGSGSGSTTTGTPQAAMGGPINYPEGYQKNITFAMGGNVDMTTGELEHGENLNVHRNGRWKTVTKYESGGMGRHNADGTPKPNQDVALPFGGSIASRLYQKEDDLAEATNDTLHKEALHGKVIMAKSGGYVRDSYANGGPVNGELRFPGRIEWTKRKKEAKEEAMAMKKYGGAIKRMFAKGGMVPMYNGGSTVMGPFLQDPTGNPVSVNPNAPAGYVPGTYENITYGSFGQNQDLSNFGKYAPYALQGLPIAWNLMQGVKKSTKVPGTLGNMPTDLQAPKLSGEAGRRALAREGAAARYAWRQAGAQAGPATLTAMTNARMGRIADFEEGLRNTQAQMDYQAAAQRKAYEQFNAQQAMNRYMLQAQADAVPTQYTSAGMGQLGQMGESMLNRQALKELYG